MAAPSFEPGTIFAGDFEVLGLLASGGMGAVYRVKQASTGRLRALKVMHPDLVLHDEARGRFAQEARVGAQIASAHVVEVHGAGVDEASGAPYLVMELLDGEDLEARITRSGPLVPAEARELFRQTCHAIGAAHDAHIVHRDLKPSNVFLAVSRRAIGEDLDVKVLDFGIAKLAHGGQLTAHVATAAGALLGTPLWMAPEQADAGAAGPAADVWALGLMLYFVLTGRAFWRSGNDGRASLTEFFRELLVDPIPSPVARAGQQGTSFPANLEIVFRRSVTRQPLARYPDASAFWSALDAALAGLPQAPLKGSRRTDVSPLAPTATADERRSGVELQHTELAYRTVPRTVFAQPLGARTERGLALLDSRSEPWNASHLGYAIGVLCILGAALFAYERWQRGSFVGVCRLCTVEAESETYANGPVPLREIRHDVEEILPSLDTRCLTTAPRGGRMHARFSITASKQTERYQIADLRFTPGDDDTARCLSSAFRELDFGSQPIGRQGSTEVGYTLEFDPHHAR